MADFHTRFSTAILGAPEALRELEAIFDFFNEHAGYLDGLIDQDFIDAGLEISLERTELFKKIDTDNGGALGVEASIEPNAEGRFLWLRAEESCDMDGVVTILQDWLQETGSSEAIQIEYANTATKPVIDGFGGGAIHITAKQIRSIDSGAWLREQTEFDRHCAEMERFERENPDFDKAFDDDEDTDRPYGEGLSFDDPEAPDEPAGKGGS